jgi:hypothetical protein
LKLKKDEKEDKKKKVGESPQASKFQLPTLDTDAPKLQHLGTDRPRRLKTKAVTRPTVGYGTTVVEQDEDGVGEGISDFFSHKPAEIVGSSPAVNGDVEKGLELSASAFLT